MRCLFVLSIAAVCVLSENQVNSQEVTKQVTMAIGAPFVAVDSVAQLHSKQLFSSNAASLLDELDAEVRRLKGRLVKLHVVAVDEAAIDDFGKAVRARYGSASLPLPAISCMAGKLASQPQSKLGVDAVIALPKDFATDGNRRTSQDTLGRVLYPGARVYISGQAEKGSSPAEATRLTLASLQKTLEWLGSTTDDIVQVKAFLKPISAADEVRTEFAKFAGDRQIPLVLVEWNSTLPIEIELIAAAPSTKPSNTQAVDTTVEYLTPPGMTASPVYCRVAKVSAPDTIYIGGCYSRTAANGEQQVTEIFESLRTILQQSGSDFNHLVKATYYCSSNDTSTQLNVLRPRYYDPGRPPAASKAMVASVGLSQRQLTLDMIAVAKPTR